jgi:hypothetical protein
MPRRQAAGRQPRSSPLHLGRRWLLVAAQRLFVAALQAQAHLLRPQRAIDVQATAAASAAARPISAAASVAAAWEGVTASAAGRLAEPSAPRLCQVRRVITGVLSRRALRRNVVLYDKLAAVLLWCGLRAIRRLLC